MWLEKEHNGIWKDLIWCDWNLRTFKKVWDHLRTFKKKSLEKIRLEKIISQEVKKKIFQKIRFFLTKMMWCDSNLRTFKKICGNSDLVQIKKIRCDSKCLNQHTHTENWVDPSFLKTYPEYSFFFKPWWAPIFCQHSHMDCSCDAKHEA